VVCVADPAALKAGIRIGQTLAQARALVPDLHVEDEDRPALVKAQQALSNWCQFLSPLSAPDGEDGIWIDSSGCDHLHGGERPMAGTLRDQLRARGYHARIGLADTAGAAHALARYGNGACDGPVIAPCGRHQERLDPLPVQALRLDKSVCLSLHKLGLHDIGTLRRAPRAPLARRFGTTALLRLDQAMGLQAEPINPVFPVEAIQHRETFVEPIGTAEAIATVIARLVAGIVPQLDQRGRGARQLDLFCERVDEAVQALRVGTSTPVRAEAPLIKLLCDQIETIQPGFGIEATRLVVSQDEHLRDGQTESLSASEDRDGDLSGFIDHVRNRYGAQSVTRLAHVATHIPERSQRQLTPDTVPRDQRLETWPDCPWPRPTRLFDPVRPIRTMSLLPDHTPEAFSWNRKRYRIVRSDGPERLHGEWWHSADEFCTARDYWHVETEEGEHFWLFRKGADDFKGSGDGAWFLHGIF